MAKYFFLTVTLGVCFFLQACATNIVYTNEDRQQCRALQDLRADIFIDRNGDLYPPPSIPINSEGMFTTSRKTTATLYAYYQQEKHKDDWENLLTQIHVNQSKTFKKTWEKVQTQLLESISQTIVEGSDRGNKRIIFLVHGYNSQFQNSSNWYCQVEQDIFKRLKNKGESTPYIVRVYWDGLSQFMPLNIWTRAQWNGPLTGLTLRALLHRLDGSLVDDTKIVMLSHSTGALVVANAVGDGSGGLPCKTNFKEHCPAIKDPESIPPIVANIRLGFLIPAASPHTFSNYTLENQTLPQAIILGLNKQDFPTNKVLSCIFMGSTCLNVHTENTCLNISSTFVNYPVEFSVLEFSNSSKDENQQFLFWETHNVEDQMKRDKWSAFIERVLFSNTGSTHDAVCEQRFNK